MVQVVDLSHLGNVVTLKKPVTYKTLETALLAAARDVGLGTKTVGSYTKASHEETQTSSEEKNTLIYLIGRTLPSMTVNVQGTDSIQEISILTEPPYGYLPEERVQERVHQYLTSVYKRLGQEQP